MVVKLVDLNLPLDPVGGTVLNLNGQISTVVEAAELTGWNGSSLHSTGSWCLLSGAFLRFVEGRNLSAVSLTTSEVL